MGLAERPKRKFIYNLYFYETCPNDSASLRMHARVHSIFCHFQLTHWNILILVYIQIKTLILCFLVVFDNKTLNLIFASTPFAKSISSHVAERARITLVCMPVTMYLYVDCDCIRITRNATIRSDQDCVAAELCVLCQVAGW